MAAARSSSSLRAAHRLFTAAAPSTTRALHMTGPATYPSTLLTTDRTTTAAKAEPSARAVEPATTAAPTRHFNTSRALKAVGDSSTIDFAYLPELDPDSSVTPVAIRVPLLPVGLYPSTTQYDDDATAETVMRPEIQTASADGDAHISAFAEAHDNGAGEIDYNRIADVASAGARRARNGQAVGAEEVGVLRQVWRELFDDAKGKA